MADVFISYSGKSPDTAEQIADELGRAGISCWIAKRNIKAGEDFATAINNAIKNCKVFLLVLDKNSSQSQHVANEVSLAFRRVNDGMVLLPFKTEECEISESIDYYITRFHLVDGTLPTMDKARNLVDEIVFRLKFIPSFAQKKPDKKIDFIFIVLLALLCAISVILFILCLLIPQISDNRWNSFMIITILNLFAIYICTVVIFYLYYFRRKS